VDDELGRLVADCRPALLRTALLLTGDRATAEELVQRALGRARRAADPRSAALAALVDGATSRRRRLARVEQVIDTLPDPFAAPHTPEPARPDLADLLRDLPPRTRAALVLRWHERLPDSRTAELLHCDVGTAAAEADRGLAELAPALAPSGYERAVSHVPVEQRLAGSLARLAAAPAQWRLDGAQAVADVRGRRTAARRRIALGVAAVLCVAGVGVPLARWAPDPAPAASPTATAPPAAAPAPAPLVPVLAGAPRGSLAGDAEFLAAVQTTSWGAQDAPPPADRDVVFAADTPDGRVALVVGTVLEDFRGTWLTGPVGAPADQLVPHLPQQLGRERPSTLLLGGPGPATLVVVAAPGDVISVSDRLMTGPRGTVGREYTPVDAADGTAVVPSRTGTLGPAVSVQVVRAGREVYRSAVDRLGSAETPYATPPGLTPLRSAGPPADDHLVADALTQLAVPLGVEPAALKPAVLWSAELSLDRGTGRVAVVVAYSPGGALVVTTWAGTDRGAVGCGTQTPPGTTDVTTLTVARVCAVTLPGPGRDDARWLVFTAPPAAAAAELLDARGRVLAPLALTDGSTVADLPDGARSVRTLAADGQPLAEVPIAPAPTEPFGDFGSGPQR